jgi:hypothetical protein
MVVITAIARSKPMTRCGRRRVIASSYVTSPSAGSAVLAASRVLVRGSTGAALAFAQVSPAGASPGTRIVSVRAAPQFHGNLRAWVCPTQSTGGGQPKSCTAAVTVRSVARFKLPSGMSGPVRVVVIRRRR